MARPSGPRFTATEISDIIRRYDAGESAQRIAVRYKSKYDTIGRVLDQHGVQRHSPRKLTVEQERELCRRYASGERSLALTEEYGIAHLTFRRIIALYGLSLRGHSDQYRQWGDEEIAQIRAWTEARISQAVIASRLNTNQVMISRLMRMHNIMPQFGGRGERSGLWKGGRIITSDGYVRVRVTSDESYINMRDKAGYVLEHRMVMARHLGRSLTAHESVHHINGDKTDNRVENLQVRIGQHGKGVTYCCADCGSRNIVECPLDHTD